MAYCLFGTKASAATMTADTVQQVAKEVVFTAPVTNTSFLYNICDIHLPLLVNFVVIW